MEEYSYNPFRIIWNIFSVAVTVISLSNLSSSIVEWMDFYNRIIAIYQLVTNYFWNQLIFWMLPFDLPNWLKDYLTVGILFSSAVIRSELEVKGLENGLLNMRNIIEIIIGHIIWAIIWPVVMLYGFKVLSTNAYPDETERKQVVRSFQWFGSAIVIFCIIVLVTLVIEK